jgi:hypothetical protein
MQNTIATPAITSAVIQRFVLQRMRVHLWLSAAGVAAGWVMYLLSLLFDVNLLDFSGTADSRAVGYLVVAIIVTLALGIFAAIALAKGRALAARGRITRARLVKVSGISRNGVRPVTYAYVVDGREYEARRDNADEDIDGFSSESVFFALYDTQRPAKATVLLPKELHVPESDIHGITDVVEAVTGGLCEGVAQGVPMGLAKVIWPVLFLGQLLAIFALVQQAGGMQLPLVAAPVFAAALGLTLSELLLWQKIRGQSGLSTQATQRLQKVGIAICAAVLAAWAISVFLM